jgi:hypothetical protein
MTFFTKDQIIVCQNCEWQDRFGDFPLGNIADIQDIANFQIGDGGVKIVFLEQSFAQAAV